MRDYATKVKTILQEEKDGLTFVDLVRKLYECYEEPTLVEMQATLKLLVLRQEIIISGGDRNRPRFVSTRYNGVASYILTDEALDMVIGRFDTWEEAWNASAVDWFATGENRRCIYRAKPSEQFIYPGDEKELDSVPAYVGSWQQPLMPKYERLTMYDAISHEMAAISKALRFSLNKSLYTRLREDAEGGKVKLAFSVEVDLDACSVVAKMAGSIKLMNRARVDIEDQRQLELNLGKEVAHECDI